ncbi:MAG: hypothetical protein JWQ44_2800 [Chthoniobacter sp.]|nr:hypothetical protein [Chthoniobacter sp.]
MIDSHSSARCERLLDAMLLEPHRRVELTDELHAVALQTRAVLVLDMCGFTRVTRQLGIVAFLLMIRRMRRICEPCFAAHGGTLLRAEADNLFYFFDSPAAAVAGSQAALAEVARANTDASAEEHLCCAIGIGYGQVLCLSEENVHGEEVNVAFKLGEDVAQAGQILLTESARAALDPAAVSTRRGSAVVSGLELTFHEVIHDFHPSAKQDRSGLQPELINYSAEADTD